MKEVDRVYAVILKRSLILFNLLFKSKYACLCWLLFPLVLGFTVQILSHQIGNKDGLISGNGKWSVHDILFLLLYIIPIAVYYKVRYLQSLKLSWFLLLAFPVAFFIRLYFASFGGNFDIQSYNIVADIVLRGDSVYANTNRYNYAPVWSYVLAGCKFIALHFSNTDQIFHYLIVTIFFAAESYIGYQLYKKYKNAYILLFFLFNPIGIIISGHHSQFDVLAIAIAFAAVLEIDKNNIFKAAFLLGLSLAVKHVMVFYAFFLLFDKHLSLRNKVVLTILPLGIFMISFLPFLGDIRAIKENVFEYKFRINSGIYPQILHLILPEKVVNSGLFKWLPVFKDLMFFWLITMLWMGYLTNKYCRQYLFEIYLLVLVFTSVTISEQYLYIPVLALAVFYKFYASWVYTFLTGFYLLFVSFHNMGPQNWIRKFFSIDFIYEDLYFTYPIIQVWLLVLLVGVFRKYRIDTVKGHQMRDSL